jgi:VCBS repeat protein
MTAAALAAAVLLVAAASALAAFVKEGSPYPVGNDPYSLNAADFNGDGRPDVATINGTSSDVSVFLRQAGGGFAQEAGSPVSVGAGSGPSGAAVGDYNGDGRMDIAVSTFVAGTVAVLLRQPGGGFALEGTPIALGVHTTAIASGDFNSDGRTDLAVTQNDGNQVLILLRNAPNNGFSVQMNFPTGLNPRAIAVGDYNGDNLPDLAIANQTGDSVTILLRVAAGTFASEAAVPAGDDVAGIVAADFDGNGRDDLAVTNFTPDTVTAFLRNGQNTGFTAQTPISVSASPVGIDAGDFDRDGRPDLAVASNAGAVNIIHRTAGGFTRDPAIAVSGAVNDVVAADFDGDSRPDVAASSYTNTAAPDTFSVLLNPAPPPVGPTLPPPVAGKSVNVEPVSGTVKIKRRGRKRFVTLTAAAHIPVGSTIDTRRGRITITADQGKGKTGSADFYQGLFRFTQAKRSKLTTLTLTERLSCSRKPASAAAKKKRKRRLWGDGHGRFRTKGKRSAATVVGTKWLVEDRCTSTLTRVARGKVKVRDFAKRKTVTVRAGHRYIARAKRR